MGTKKIGIKLIIIFFTLLLFDTNSFCQKTLWETQFKSNNNIFINSLGINETDHLYVLGNFNGLSHWNEYDFSISFGGSDIFLLKYNKDNELIRSQKFGGISTDYSGKIVCDVSGDIIFYGRIGRNTIFYDTIVSLKFFSKYYNDNFFIAKYDENNQRKWIKIINDSTYSLINIYDLKTDINSNIYLLGTRYNETDSIYALPNKNIVLLKYNSSGNLLWKKQFSSSFGSHKCSLSIMDDRIFLTYQKVKYTESTFYSDRSTIARIDSIGNIIWEKEYDNQYVRHLTLDNNGNVYFITQEYEYTTYNYMYNNDWSYFYITKIDINGNRIWSKLINGATSSEISHGINPSNIKYYNDNIYVSSNYACVNILVDNVNYGDNSNSFISKFSTDGQLIWFKNFDFSNRGDFVFKSDSNFYISAWNKTSKEFIALIPNKEQSFIINEYPHIFPNPCNNYTRIISNVKLQSTYSLEIFNINGILLKKYIINKEPFILNTSLFPRGIYFFKIINDDKITTRKVIIQ